MLVVFVFLIMISVPLLIGFGVYTRYRKFNNSNYKMASGNSFSQTMFNAGNYGEYVTFTYLERLEGHVKLMTNLYIPKEDGSTTELDLVMLTQKGIYVFESKNYSGWIFGDEKNKYWMQTLESKQKNRFFNPIWQNKGHIDALKSVLELDNDSLFKSYIIFSERCTIKKMSVVSPNVKVMKRNFLLKTIRMDMATSPNLLTIAVVNQFYVKLQKYACVDEGVKRLHIENIQNKYQRNSKQKFS